MEYKPPRPKPKRGRQRKVVWFNPPFSLNVKSNVGQMFLKLVDESFPPGHPLRGYFNRSTIKIAYSTVKNVRAIVDSHNRKLLNPRPAENISCNCRRKEECPLNGNCLVKEICYRGDVITEESLKTYYGITCRSFKERWYEHNHAIKNKNSSKATELSNYIWQLKEENKPYTLKFSIQSKASAYSSGSRRCQLCTKEQLAIALEKPKRLLNQRREIMGKCIHKGKLELRRCTRPP